ncbi:hypothetical protein [Peribacillus frigoritolerans]|uniref:hypothetical protein n=1 Tax=Peribacillus frigoritolerans TaxID=450367 RepID=UPI002B245FCC|nr:hypothetical protein [Peribacillus frigoritolerans]MEB2629250.1 hypothetical protein [Peribacillus frigoritolerans]
MPKKDFKTILKQMHTVIAENKKLIEFDEDSEQKPKELGTFKLGEKVNVVGHIFLLRKEYVEK